MNPSTILRIYEALYPTDGPVHILDVAARSGSWTSTLYKAKRLGYLYQPRQAHLSATPKLVAEVRRIREVQSS